jgi:hypothetical protein
MTDQGGEVKDSRLQFGNLKITWGLGIFEMEALSSYFLGLKDDSYFLKS